MELLQKEAELQEIVQLVGPDALPERERMILEGARMIREDFLQQNAFHEIDTYCSPKKQYKMLKVIMEFYRRGMHAVSKGVSVKKIIQFKVRELIARLKEVKDEELDDAIKKIMEVMDEEFKSVLG